MSLNLYLVEVFLKVPIARICNPDSADLQSVPTKRIKGGFVISAKEKPDERVLENASSLKYLFSDKSSFFGQYRKKSKILKPFEDFDNKKLSST
jgi:hypothetical protein